MRVKIHYGNRPCIWSVSLSPSYPWTNSFPILAAQSHLQDKIHSYHILFSLIFSYLSNPQLSKLILPLNLLPAHSVTLSSLAALKDTGAVAVIHRKPGKMAHSFCFSLTHGTSTERVIFTMQPAQTITWWFG